MSDSTTIWISERTRLINIAYRMLGSQADAEDVVQEVFIRFSAARLEEIDDPPGWLVTVTARLCIDQLRSARARRETYVGPWLPEPIVENRSDPAHQITLDESVQIAMLVVLEQLTPAERATFILHDVFRLPFETIAEVVGRTPQACRQLASRARHRIASAPAPRFDVDSDYAARVAAGFARACETGDVAALTALLDPGVQGLFDSGGHIPGAPTDAVHGALMVAPILIGAFDDTDARFLPTTVNGGPGVLVTLDGTIVSVISLAVRDGLITHVHGIGNPDKLAHLTIPDGDGTETTPH